jgi:hypothetical protein
MDMNEKDLYSPYGCGMTAQHAVEALWRAAGLPETLKSYSKIITSTTPPVYTDADNDNLFWYCTTNNKLYRASRNKDLQLLVWFEV